MLITKSTPFTKKELDSLKKEFDVYIKTVIDLEKKLCSAGMESHQLGKEALLAQGGNQAQIWGGGVDLMTKEIDFHSFINIRPDENNPHSEIASDKIKKDYLKLSAYFFKVIL